MFEPCQCTAHERIKMSVGHQSKIGVCKLLQSRRHHDVSATYLQTLQNVLSTKLYSKQCAVERKFVVVVCFRISAAFFEKERALSPRLQIYRSLYSGTVP